MVGKSKYGINGSVSRSFRHITSISLIITLFAAFSFNPQENSYWKNAPVGKTKIFTISFINKQIGVANSADDEVLATSDGGKNWKAESKDEPGIQATDSDFEWKADIYCAIMKTTNGGNTWFPYENGKQEHFCGVYLKDENSGYKVASEFLQKVTMEINYYYLSNKLDTLLDHPQQCTEYYKSAEEGWALGWCVRNLKK